MYLKYLKYYVKINNLKNNNRKDKYCLKVLVRMWGNSKPHVLLVGT